MNVWDSAGASPVCPLNLTLIQQANVKGFAEGAWPGFPDT